MLNSYLGVGGDKIFQVAGLSQWGVVPKTNTMLQPFTFCYRFMVLTNFASRKIGVSFFLKCC